MRCGVPIHLLRGGAVRAHDRAVVNTPLSSLVVGDRVVSRSDDGLLDAEYALFDRSEVILTAATGQGVREEGYMTTVGFARARLHEALITADLAHEAFAALRTRHMRPLARSPEVATILDQLGPYEAFEGGTFRAQRGRYTGVWLDLDTLASAAPLRGAALLFQAMHLLLVLEEVSEDVPVRLLTGPVSDERRPGERTWRKVTLEAAPAVGAARDAGPHATARQRARRGRRARRDPAQPAGSRHVIGSRPAATARACRGDRAYGMDAPDGDAGRDGRAPRDAADARSPAATLVVPTEAAVVSAPGLAGASEAVFVASARPERGTAARGPSAAEGAGDRPHADGRRGPQTDRPAAR